MSGKVMIRAVGNGPPLVEAGLNQHFSLTRERAWPLQSARTGARSARRLPYEHDQELRGLAVCGGHTRIDAAFVEPFARLEIVSSFGVGYDHIDAASLAARGIVVTHTPDVLTDEVADLALGLLIATVRQLPQADRCLRAGRWLQRPYPLSATLRGRKIGILGLGRIGKAIARRVQACGLPVEYHGRKPQPGVEYPSSTATTGRGSAWRKAATC